VRSAKRDANLFNGPKQRYETLGTPQHNCHKDARIEWPKANDTTSRRHYVLHNDACNERSSRGRREHPKLVGLFFTLIEA
jgi:hypothetical protein